MIHSSKLAMAVSLALISVGSAQAAVEPDVNQLGEITVNGSALTPPPSLEGKFQIGFDGDTVFIDNSKLVGGNGVSGLFEKEGTEATVLGQNITFNGLDKNYAMRLTGTKMVLGNDATGTVNITNGYWGLLAVKYNGRNEAAVMEINGDKLVITGTQIGIHAQNNDDTAPRKDLNSAPSKDAGTYVLVNSKDTFIEAGASGIVALSGSRVDVMGNLTIKAPTALDVRGNSLININQTGNHVVQLDGNIAFETPGSSQNSGETLDAYVNINLDNAQSYWNGNVLKQYRQNLLDKPNADLSVNNLRVSLSNGATWNPTVITDKVVPDGNGDYEVKYQALNHLTLNGGIVNVNSADVNVQVENLVGSGQVNLATDGTTAGTFKVDQADANASLDVSFLDNKGDVLTSDTLTAEQAKALSANVTGVKNTTTKVQEGMYNGAIEIAPDGTVAHKGNTLMQSTLELASAAPLAMNRIMMNDVRKRLGDLRSVQDLPHGAWARYDGGKLSGDNGLQNEFNTIQVGADTMALSDNIRVGAAFAYSKGDVDYARGTADMEAYSLSAYGVWFGQNGQFVDVVGRVARAETDMTVDANKFGTAKNTAYSLSAEGGWRFDVMQNAYVEPQTELTYTYINAEDVNIGDASYEIDSVNSLMGRVGVAAGLKCPSGMGDVYVRASMVHEFLGDAEIRGANGTSYSTEGKDTWFEYGIGANFNVNKATYVYADVERTSGSALDEDWRANVGVRYSF